MYNTKQISGADLPSTLTLIKATIIAFIVALSLLVTVILPAEYGIDPTGVGKVIGLKEMGEIKVSLAKEAQQAQQNEKYSVISEKNATDAQASASIQPISNIIKSDSRTIELANGEAAELKLAMEKGNEIRYQWVSSKEINFDNHGDAPSVEYYRYSKGRNVVKDSGKIQAAFDGYHGWFWRNRSGKAVTITIKFSGDFGEVKRVK